MQQIHHTQITTHTTTKNQVKTENASTIMKHCMERRNHIARTHATYTITSPTTTPPPKKQPTNMNE